MKKLFLLGVLSIMIYSCQKTTIQPNTIVNNIQNPQQQTCRWAGIYVADSVATVNFANLYSSVDTIVHLTSELINTGDSTRYDGRILCKYRLDFTTLNLSYLNYSTKHVYNTMTFSDYQYDTIAFVTNTNKTIVMVKQH